MISLFVKLFLIFILLISGVSKIINPQPMIEVLQSLPYFPEQLIIISTTMLPIFELVLSLLMILKYKEKFISVLCGGLFLFFFIFSIYGTVIGIDKECGCFGSLIKSYFDWEMILRNFILLGLSSYIIFSNFKIQNHYFVKEDKNAL